MSSDVLVRVTMADNNADRAAQTLQHMLEDALRDHGLGREVLETPIVVYSARRRGRAMNREEVKRIEIKRQTRREWM